jgi:cell division protein FtsB
VRYLIAFLVTIILLLQYRLWFGDGNVLEFRRLNERIEELRREGAKRRERNAALEAEVMDLKQGLDAVEERARQDLGMIREGEVFVQVIDPHHEEAPPPVPPEDAKKPAEKSKPVRHKPRRIHARRAAPAAPAVREPQAPEPAATEPEPEEPPVEESDQ